MSESDPKTRRSFCCGPSSASYISGCLRRIGRWRRLRSPLIWGSKFFVDRHVAMLRSGVSHSKICSAIHACLCNGCPSLATTLEADMVKLASRFTLTVHKQIGLLFILLGKIYFASKFAIYRRIGMMVYQFGRRSVNLSLFWPLF